MSAKHDRDGHTSSERSEGAKMILSIGTAASWFESECVAGYQHDASTLQRSIYLRYRDLSITTYEHLCT